jgi:FtsP/CotA-like multicopper oxidase with cupredoxin domain
MSLIRPTRRQALMGAAALALTPNPTRAASPVLTAGTRVINVNGQAATVFGLTGPDGRLGLQVDQGWRLQGEVLNATDQDLILHWHGQLLAPFDQDRARPGGGLQVPGQSDRYDFALTPGTHWMHSHTLSEQQLMAAPMVCRPAGGPVQQEVVMFLHDFAFRPPAEIAAALGAPGSHAHGAAPAATEPMDHAAMGHDMAAMAPGMVHANDVTYDAYLTNDRTLADPDVITVDPGAPVLLRIINAATATAFWIDAGALNATVTAVDGSPVQPLATGPIPIAMGQRIDLTVQIPPGGGAFPVLARVEAARFQTGLIFATPGAIVTRVPDLAEIAAPHTDISLDRLLRPAVAPAPGDPARMIHVMLGQGDGYVWSINGQTHGNHQPLRARLGERLELMFMNPTSMMHPMHLHGHHFQVVGLGSDRIDGPVRDTVIVPPGVNVTVALTADKIGAWYMHCHHLYHMAGGMMTELVVTA